VNLPPLLYGVALVVSFVTALVGLPAWRRWCSRTGLVDDPGARKIHAEPVALAGGLTVFAAMALPLLAAVIALQLPAAGGAPATNDPAAAADHHFLVRLSLLDADKVMRLVHGLNRRAMELAILFLGAGGMLAVGVLDDKHELRPAAKFAGQCLVALAVAAAGVRITLFVPSLVFSYAVTVLWILAVVNAFNFMDNMNGLCGGLGAIGALCFALIAARDGQYLVALIAFQACGALLGFLPWNFPRARAFLGDAGSHLVGYLLAVLAILPHFYTRDHPRTLATLSPLLILAVPLGDLVRVVLYRWRRGKPFYVGDTNHLSHRLVQLGLSRTQAVLLIWGLAALLGALALI
jgi:UDP-GlcNAc:undecaprenyl-phosphate/decaprenyl-phosphate GlcNAc-1-phosphate transferase